MHHAKPCAAALFAAALFTLPLFADETLVEEQNETTNSIPPIIVQASRLDQSTMQMPASVQVITAEQIAAAGHRTTLDVLEKQAGVIIRRMAGNPTLAQPAMRGFGDNSHGRVLVLLNGERLNNPDMSSPNLLRIPPATISRIEVIHGPQTVLHGDFASAGVINIITDDTTIEPRTTLSAMLGSYETYTGHASTTGGFEDEEVTYRASADWERSNGYRSNSDYKTWSLNAALRKGFGENRYISLSTFYHDSEYGLPGSLSYREYRKYPTRSNTPDDKSELKTYGMDLGTRLTLGDDIWLDTHFNASHRETDSQWHGFSYGSFWHSYYDSDIDSFSLLPQLVVERTIAGFENRLTLGSDLRYAHSSIGSDYYSQPYVISKSSWQFDRSSVGGYIHDELFLTDALSITAGGRMEWFMNRIRGGGLATSNSSRQHALEAALLYRFNDTAKLYAKVGRIYHAPFIDEIFAGAGTPNLSLQPERGMNYEIGGEIMLAKEWSASLALYNMELKDEIYYDPSTFQNLNSPGDTRRLGLDASLAWARERVGSAFIAYNAVHSEFTGGPYSHKRVPMVPTHVITVGGDYYVIHDVAVMGNIRHLTRQYLGSDFNHDGPTLPSYVLVDLGIRYEPSKLPGLRLMAGVDNVFESRYCEYAGWSSSGGAYYYPGQGRFWKVGASYSF